MGFQMSDICHSEAEENFNAKVVRFPAVFWLFCTTH